MPAKKPRPGVRTVTDARALSAMANPFRSRMMDALKVDGPSTASALATRTGQAVGSASHHLKVLHEAGLLDRSKRGVWVYYAVRTSALDDLAGLIAGAAR
jgi:DNA-binding transcriptional ArsR family regulator